MQEKKDSLFVCGGCNAKIGAGVLSGLLKSLPKTFYPGLLVGFDSSDDAAVIKMSEDLAIIQTLDFFPPMVTNPYIFGQVAATNALSDVYAMGGEPVCALNIVCYPEEGIDGGYSALEKILLGGTEKIKEAGAALAGGHSIHDPKPKYGLSVMGKIHPEKIWKNDTPQEGDVLFLTKKLGVGIITTAYSVGEVPEEAFNEAVKSMTTLNKYAAEVLRNFDIHSCTDVTGFALIGHLSEMVTGNFTAVLNSKEIPFIKEAYKAANEFLLTAGGQRNRNFAAGKVLFNIKDFAMEEILFDPQTSGGLLFAVSKREAEKIKDEFKKRNLPLWQIGEIHKREEAAIKIN
ncbi:selenide, water dikinase SelD [Treponema pedis]|uniref:Selenide, water dikinase n=1 Tax=Treponema pedis TaxID=409322 RepID=A0A7S7AW66_9SPIR|nr:selenide, water dikinase SelD [Treponema pedis]QOW60321.1 selenide, water dikinase SelD [Treponema pedis]